jgi:hypothetical protein
MAEHTYALFLLVGMKSDVEVRAGTCVNQSSDQLKVSEGIMVESR